MGLAIWPLGYAWSSIRTIREAGRHHRGGGPEIARPRPGHLPHAPGGLAARGRRPSPRAVDRARPSRRRARGRARGAARVASPAAGRGGDPASARSWRGVRALGATEATAVVASPLPGGLGEAAGWASAPPRAGGGGAPRARTGGKPLSMGWDLLVCDLDGTLVGKSEPLDPALVKAFHCARERGLLISLATGRMPPGAERFRDELGLTAPCIYYNGALVRDHEEGRDLFSLTLPRGPPGPGLRRLRQCASPPPLLPGRPALLSRGDLPGARVRGGAADPRSSRFPTRTTSCAWAAS